MLHARTLSVTAIAGLCLFGAPAHQALAQEHLTEEAREDLREQAVRILEATAMRYREIETYRDRVEIQYDITTKGDAPSPFADEEAGTERLDLSIINPNQIAFTGEGIELYSDGTNTWLAIEWFGQYMKTTAPDTYMDLPDTVEPMMLAAMLNHPALSLIFGSHEAFADFAPELTSVERIDFELAEGRQYRLIEGTMHYSMGMGDPLPVKVRFELSTDTDLLERAEYDMTELYNTMRENMLAMMGDDAGEMGMELPEYERFVMRANVLDMQINQILDAEAFSYDPPAGMELVDSFDFGGGWDDSQQMELVGDEAPAFSERTLEGDTLALEDLRGKVVLLDFWAMWCMPCVQALPHFQTIHEHFDGQDVIVLGVNRDPHDSEDRMKKFLEEREITFGHVLDFDGEVAAKYHVSGIPCSVLIDANGVIRDIGVGFAPGKEKELIARIEALLEEPSDDGGDE